MNQPVLGMPCGLVVAQQGSGPALVAGEHEAAFCSGGDRTGTRQEQTGQPSIQGVGTAARRPFQALYLRRPVLKISGSTDTHPSKYPSRKHPAIESFAERFRLGLFSPLRFLDPAFSDRPGDRFGGAVSRGHWRTGGSRTPCSDKRLPQWGPACHRARDPRAASPHLPQI